MTFDADSAEQVLEVLEAAARHYAPRATWRAEILASVRLAEGDRRSWSPERAARRRERRHEQRVEVVESLRQRRCLVCSAQLADAERASRTYCIKKCRSRALYLRTRYGDRWQTAAEERSPRPANGKAVSLEANHAAAVKGMLSSFPHHAVARQVTVATTKDLDQRGRAQRLVQALRGDRGEDA